MKISVGISGNIYIHISHLVDNCTYFRSHLLHNIIVIVSNYYNYIYVTRLSAVAKF